MQGLQRIIAAAIAACAAAACTSSPEAREAGDPFEPLNRRVYAFNQTADENVIRPTAVFYESAAPNFARQGVRNFFDNLNQPVIAANGLLQADLPTFGSASTRFALNTTIGMGGLFDVASQAGVPEPWADFGQTLGRWGAPSGPYLMLPILGPSNLRDATGRFADNYIHPYGWNPERLGREWIAGGTVLDAVDLRARLDETVRALDRTAIDPYVQLRSGYQQRREALIKGEAATAPSEDFDDLPDFN